MENKYKFIKFFWFPAILMIGSLSFAIYMAWDEVRTKNHLVDRALQGNQYAIKILIKYEKPWKLDHRLLEEALKGNSYALNVLSIDSKK